MSKIKLSVYNIKRSECWTELEWRRQIARQARKKILVSLLLLFTDFWPHLYRALILHRNREKVQARFLFWISRFWSFIDWVIHALMRIECDRRHGWAIEWAITLCRNLWYRSSNMRRIWFASYAKIEPAVFPCYGGKSFGIPWAKSSCLYTISSALSVEQS